MLTQDGSVPFIPGSSRMRIVLAAVAFLGAMLAVESAYSQFVQTLVPALPGVARRLASEDGRGRAHG